MNAFKSLPTELYENGMLFVTQKLGRWKGMVYVIRQRLL